MHTHLATLMPSANQHPKLTRRAANQTVNHVTLRKQDGGMQRAKVVLYSVAWSVRRVYLVSVGIGSGKEWLLVNTPA